MGSNDCINSSNNNTIKIQSDNPIESIVEDHFHRKEFVEAISSFINAIPNKSSNIVGIIGEWGSGKTSIANLLKNELSDDITIIDICPWVLSDEVCLTEHLLRSLSTVKETYPNHDSKNKLNYLSFLMRKIGASVQLYIKRVSNLALIKELNIKTLIAEYIKYRNNPYDGISIEDFKSLLSDRFSRINKTVVFIDDIDRLMPDEIRELMRAIRSVADFDNIIYILLYDETIVSKSLTTQSYNGEDYLKKIIQHRFHLPEVRKTDLRIYLEVEYKSIVSDCSDQEKNHLAIISQMIINYNINMRDCKNLLSSFEMRYRMSCGNTFSPDLLMMTFYELFYPKLYVWIGNHRHLLCEDSKIRDYINNENPVWSTVEKDIDSIHYDALKHLFPTIISKKTYDDHVNIIEAKRYRRVCSDIHIDNYFLMVPGALPFSRSYIKKLITNASTEEISSAIIHAHADGTLSSLMIDIINDISDCDRIDILSKIVCFECGYASQEMIDSRLVRIPYSEELIKLDQRRSGLSMYNYLKERMKTQSILSISRLYEYLERLQCFNYNSTFMSQEESISFNSMVHDFIMQHHQDVKLVNYPIFATLINIISRIDPISGNQDAQLIVNYHITCVKDMLHFLDKCKDSPEAISQIAVNVREDIIQNERVKNACSLFNL